MSILQKRDYTVIIDRSGSMATRDMPSNKTRWQACQEGTLALAAKIEELDPDGITVYTFASKFNRYDNVTAAKVADVFKENEPNGSTALDTVLQDAFDNYFQRKAAGKTQENGELILVVTDGEPNDPKLVINNIIAASKKMDKDEELAVSFIQIGQDQGAKAFLKTLDDDLVGKGAKFDIVDANTSSETENMSFTELLTKAITD